MIYWRIGTVKSRVGQPHNRNIYTCQWQHNDTEKSTYFYDTFLILKYLTITGTIFAIFWKTNIPFNKYNTDVCTSFLIAPF